MKIYKSCIFFTLVFIVLAVVICLLIYDYTFSWQIQYIQPIVLPSHRSSCEFTEEAARSYHRVKNHRQWKVGMVMLYDGKLWKGTDVPQRTIENKKFYASAHNYTLHILTAADIDKSRPPAYTKLKGIRNLLPRYDYLFYIDLDTVIMNAAVKLEWYITQAILSQENGKHQADIIMSQDWFGPNTGSFLVRNSSWSLWFLDFWWGQDQFDTGYPGQYPFNYEQRGFHYLFNTSQWNRFHLKGYINATELKPHLFLIPQCALNSYIIHPIQRHGDVTSNGYLDGDFLVHTAGYKNRYKIKLMDLFLKLSKEKQVVQPKKRRLDS